MAELTGVFMAKKKDGTIYYRSSITYRNKHISLGSYEIPEDAHYAYASADTILKDPNISFPHYSEYSILKFEKFICLINFRDNGIYFSTPIYVKQKFFHYHLSPEICLKFDIDDLFYYSSHKIMQRKGHLFVADYGMQQNIVNRYGIKNFAVLDRDYRFLNGDVHDFRYENIEILNQYHGVVPIQKNGKKRYKAFIHINGNYVVGHYKTETEAAIAYNKAADIVKKLGCQKNFLQNYMEGLSPSIYADIYSKIIVSENIKNLIFPSVQVKS